MKKIFIIFTALLAHPLAAEDPAPGIPVKHHAEKPGTGIDAWVSKIDLDTHHNVGDAIKQIIAGLPPEAKSSFVVEVPAEELAKMPVKEKLRLRNTPLCIVMKYLETLSAVGWRISNNELHVCKERWDDIVTVKYRTSKMALREIGIVFGPNQSFTREGVMWPSESEWSASYTSLNPDAKETFDAENPFEAREHGVLQLQATRRYHEEFSAVLLLNRVGFYQLTLKR